MKTTKEIFVENLIRLRRERFGTQAAFAEKLGMSTRGYQKYEQGQSQPTPEILDLFAGKLRCRAWDLVSPFKETAPPNDSPVNLAAAIEFLRAFETASPLRRAVALAVLTKDMSLVEGFDQQVAQVVQLFQKES